jgi:hypothetical protein
MLFRKENIGNFRILITLVDFPHSMPQKGSTFRSVKSANNIFKFVKTKKFSEGNNRELQITQT